MFFLIIAVSVSSYYLYRAHPIAYLQTILLCLYRLTQLKEFIIFNLIYWFHNMFRPFFGHHQVYTIVYQMLFRIANRLVNMGPYKK
jgi:hypothetical protein